jgi:hypothetical protein
LQECADEVEQHRQWCQRQVDEERRAGQAALEQVMERLTSPHMAHVLRYSLYLWYIHAQVVFNHYT